MTISQIISFRFKFDSANKSQNSFGVIHKFMQNVIYFKA